MLDNVTNIPQRSCAVGLSYRDKRWAVVKRRYITLKENGCWEGLTWTQRDGYCMVHVYDRDIPLHKFAYEMLRDTVPEGKVLDHLCRNRRCCNPEHLEPVSQLENVHRSAVLKLTEEDVASIRAIHATGTSIMSAIASKFNCSQSHVSDIVSGKYRSIKVGEAHG